MSLTMSTGMSSAYYRMQHFNTLTEMISYPVYTSISNTVYSFSATEFIQRQSDYIHNETNEYVKVIFKWNIFVIDSICDPE